MKKKTIGIIAVLLVLAVVGGTVWSLRDLSQKRLLRAAENVVFADADSAAALLARVDTTRLTASSLMLYDLLRAMVYEERWYLRHADTTVCLMSDAETWNFSRQSDDRESDGVLTPDDSSRLRVFNYYKEQSLGGTTDDEDALRRFGRACFVLSRRQNDSIVPMQVNQLFHLAIHCAEATGDHALAYRAYDKFFNRMSFQHAKLPEFYLRRALKHYRQSPDQPRWLLTMLNDYGYTVLLRSPFDLHHFGSLERITAFAARRSPTLSIRGWIHSGPCPTTTFPICVPCKCLSLPSFSERSPCLSACMRKSSRNTTKMARSTGGHRMKAKRKRRSRISPSTAIPIWHRAM